MSEEAQNNLSSVPPILYIKRCGHGQSMLPAMSQKGNIKETGQFLILLSYLIPGRGGQVNCDLVSSLSSGVCVEWVGNSLLIIETLPEDIHLSHLF